MSEDSSKSRISAEPWYRLENNTASYLFKDEVCVWGDDDVLKIGALVHSDDSGQHSKPHMKTLSFTLDEAATIANTIIETCYIVREERAKKYIEMVKAEAENLDPETCDIWCQGSFTFDPYNLHHHRRSFLQCDDWDKKTVYAQNIGSEIAIKEEHIPKEKRARIIERLLEKQPRKSNSQEDIGWSLSDMEAAESSKKSTDDWET